MNIYLTFDYELFFGSNPGTFEKCIIDPTEELIKIASKYDVKMIFFIDSGYLVKLEEMKKKFKKLNSEHAKVFSQIEKLTKNGHDIQLHIHPHWEDSYFNGSHWQINTARYKLSDFKEKEISSIIERYKSVLSDNCENNITAYRAGGWCVQPFDRLRNGLKNNKITIDSSVYYQGYNLSEKQNFDFRGAPSGITKWKFEKDPLRIDENGSFWELPISSYFVNPTYNYELIFKKFWGGKDHSTFGDGTSVKHDYQNILSLLFKKFYTPVSTDGYKSSLLLKAFKHYKNSYLPTENFVTIGHPKCVSNYSLKKLELFIQRTCQNHQFKTFNNMDKA